MLEEVDSIWIKRKGMESHCIFEAFKTAFINFCQIWLKPAHLPFGQILVFPSKDDFFFPCRKEFQFLPPLETFPHFQLTRQHSMSVSWTFLHISIVWCLMFETNQHRHLGQPGKPSWVRGFIWHKSSRVCKFISRAGATVGSPHWEMPQPPTAALPWHGAKCILAQPEQALGITSALWTSLQKPSGAQCTHPDPCLHGKGAGLLWAWPAASGFQLQGKHWLHPVSPFDNRETETALLFFASRGLWGDLDKQCS